VRRWPWRALVVGCALLSLAVALLDATKPLHMDDALWVQYARHIAAHPGAPYGFEALYVERRVDANELLGACPVFLYAWAGAIALVGEGSPWAWRLAHAPFLFALALGVALLARRVSARRAPMLVALVVASPAVLPSLNLMLDVPALGLQVLAVALFERACRARRAGLACAAGLLAGLAVETKYSAVAGPLTMALIGLHRRERRLTALALGWSAVTALGIEGLIAVAHGRSHLVAALTGFDHPIRLGVSGRLAMLAGLPGLIGPLCLGPLALAAGLRRGREPAAIVGVGLLAAGLALARDAGHVDRALGVGLGAAFLAQTVGAARGRRDRTTIALLAWLAAELLTLLLVSPFLAVRRALGALVACTLIVARRRPGGRPRRPWVDRAAVAMGLATGVAAFAVDRTAARDERALAFAAAERCANLPRPHRFVGSYGFQVAALEAGLEPVVMGRTRLEGGLVVMALQPTVGPRPIPGARLVAWLEPPPRPFGTSPSFYAGPVSVRWRGPPPLRVAILRLD
jgi:hypothetical protein